jgi:hypothetical protein
MVGERALYRSKKIPAADGWAWALIRLGVLKLID